MARAWRVESPNAEFREIELPIPEPRAGEALVRIAASGVNPLDTKIRGGKGDHAKQPLPAILGLDMAGAVVKVGDGVAQFKPGDEVYGAVGGVAGLQGTLAEFVSADASLLALKPKNLSMREAAALPLSSITAWEGLVDRAHVQEGQKVLIHAGAGGVGHIAVQLARAFGAEVFATVSPDKSGIVKGYDATPIDYRSTSVEDYVRVHTGNLGFDVIYDTVGGPTIDASFQAARRYTGHVLSCLGWSAHSLAPLSFRGATYSGVFTLLPLLTGEGRAHHGEILARTAALVEAGKIKPRLNQRRFTVADIASAHAVVEAGSEGKVVVDIYAD